jgi:hypothetical protein
VTWLADILGGDSQCKWKVWFKSKHKYEKLSDPNSSSLTRWRRKHDDLVASRIRLIPAEMTLWKENETEFKLEGDVAIVAGKADVLAQARDGEAWVYDGKTGAPKSSHWWQVLWYQYALPRARKDLGLDPARIHGELFYSDAPPIYINTSELTPERKASMFSLVREVAGDVIPARVPSFSECQRCDISASDCPVRVDAAIVAKTEDF